MHVLLTVDYTLRYTFVLRNQISKCLNKKDHETGWTNNVA